MLDRQAHQLAAGGQRGADPRSGLHFNCNAPVAELADAPDLDSGASPTNLGLRVRIPSGAPQPKGSVTLPAPTCQLIFLLDARLR
jgi:hypothetical protein